jgi:hypothetical protein
MRPRVSALALVLAVVAADASASSIRSFSGIDAGSGTQRSTQDPGGGSTETFTTGSTCGIGLNGPREQISRFGADYRTISGTSRGQYLNPGNQTNLVGAGSPNATNCFLWVYPPSDGAESSYIFEFPNGYSYLGFYWGSPDPYNFIQFLDIQLNPLPVTDQSGNSLGTRVTGADITRLSGIAAPNSTFVDFNVDSNVFFVAIGTSGFAFELDNWIALDAPTQSIVADFSNLVAADTLNQVAVPAPATIALFGLSCLPLLRRRAK